jgi:hypothetical protein
MKVVGCQPYTPAAFSPRISLNSFLEADSTPGHMGLLDATEIKPAIPGTDPGTFRFVAQCFMVINTFKIFTNTKRENFVI